jgi:hypothetical protein
MVRTGEQLLAPRPTPKLENYPLPAVCGCLLNIFAATLHVWRPFFHPEAEKAPCPGDSNTRQRSVLVTSWLARRLSSSNAVLPVVSYVLN